MSHGFPQHYRSRPYAGRVDHAAMAGALSAFNLGTGDGELVTTDQLDVHYAEADPDELVRDVVIVEHDVDGVVGYGRVGEYDTPEAYVHFWVAPLRPDHLRRETLTPLVALVEHRSLDRVAASSAESCVGRDGRRVHRCWMPHPHPGAPLDGTIVSWLHDLGYRTVRFAAGMARPLADDVPELSLPDGVDVRPVSAEHLRAIYEADAAAFAGGFGAAESTEERWIRFRDDPIADPSMWKVAWHGDRIVGQVRSFVNHQENLTMGRLRGYTENISTARDWRGRGLASALLAASLHELRDRGLTEAALGVDIENPAGALAIYERLGFAVTDYQAVLDKPIAATAATVQDRAQP